MKYKVIALVGESGSGKDSILRAVVRQGEEEFHEIISCTTRPPRQHEKDGINYYFLTEQEFFSKMKAGEMLETTNFNDWYYGTPINSLELDKINIGVFNPSGIYSLLENPLIDLKIVWLHASEKERLLRQLNREDSPNVPEIIRRYTADGKDFLGFYTNVSCIHLDNESKQDFVRNVNIILGMSK